MFILKISMVDPFIASCKFNLRAVDPVLAEIEAQTILAEVGYEEDPLMGRYEILKEQSPPQSTTGHP